MRSALRGRRLMPWGHGTSPCAAVSTAPLSPSSSQPTSTRHQPGETPGTHLCARRRTLGGGRNGLTRTRRRPPGVQSPATRAIWPPAAVTAIASAPPIGTRTGGAPDGHPGGPGAWHADDDQPAQRDGPHEPWCGGGGRGEKSQDRHRAAAQEADGRGDRGLHRTRRGCRTLPELLAQAGLRRGPATDRHQPREISRPGMPCAARHGTGAAISRVSYSAALRAARWWWENRGLVAPGGWPGLRRGVQDGVVRSG